MSKSKTIETNSEDNLFQAIRRLQKCGLVRAKWNGEKDLQTQLTEEGLYLYSVLLAAAAPGQLLQAEFSVQTHQSVVAACLSGTLSASGEALVLDEIRKAFPVDAETPLELAPTPPPKVNVVSGRGLN